MSREIQVKLGLKSVEGSWKSEFRAPLILNPCQHYFETKKKGIRRKEWQIHYHGKEDGSSTIDLQCNKRGDGR